MTLDRVSERRSNDRVQAGEAPVQGGVPGKDKRRAAIYSCDYAGQCNIWAQNLKSAMEVKWES